TTRTRAKPSNVLGNFDQAHRHRLQCAAGFNASIMGTLCFEVIRGFSQWQPGGFREFRNRALRKFWMSVQTRAHRRAAKSQFPEVMTNTLQSRNSVLNLARVTAELLPQ